MRIFYKIYFIFAVTFVTYSGLALAQDGSAESNTQPLIAVEDNQGNIKPRNNPEVKEVVLGTINDENEQKTQSEPVQDTFEIRSLFFSPGDVKTIRSARSYYESVLSGKSKGEFSEDDFLKKLENVTTLKLGATVTTFTYPQFFLSSIAYYGQNDWVLWINNEKISNSNSVSQSGLRVKHVGEDKVVFEWNPQRMDKIRDIKYSPENPVRVDIVGKKVEFSLKPNQTFTSYAMRVVEGKVPPITLDENTDIVTNKKQQ